MAIVPEEKIVALDMLYARVNRIAESMGGKATPRLDSIAFREAAVLIPRTEAVNALLVEMPDSFQVELIPAYPLSVPGNVVSVNAKRTHAGGRKTDWVFNFVLAQGEWRVTQGPLSDEAIRKCLTPEGPPPIY